MSRKRCRKIRPTVHACHNRTTVVQSAVAVCVAPRPEWAVAMAVDGDRWAVNRATAEVQEVVATALVAAAAAVVDMDRVVIMAIVRDPMAVATAMT